MQLKVVTLVHALKFLKISTFTKLNFIFYIGQTNSNNAFSVRVFRTFSTSDSSLYEWGQFSNCMSMFFSISSSSSLVQCTSTSSGLVFAELHVWLNMLKCLAIFETHLLSFAPPLQCFLCFNYKQVAWTFQQWLIFFWHRELKP